ncbi:MAG: hypothetical protein K2X11_02115 [Acetobacteraceae bacterium]|nr:hypothetical protein [Acetobacteraceae bacterium]
MSDRMAAAVPRRRERDEEPMSLGVYLLHGAGWIGFLLVLFFLAGFEF